MREIHWLMHGYHSFYRGSDDIRFIQGKKYAHARSARARNKRKNRARRLVLTRTDSGRNAHALTLRRRVRAQFIGYLQNQQLLQGGTFRQRRPKILC